MTRLPFAASAALALLLFSALLSAEAVKLSGRATGAGPLAKCKVRERNEESGAASGRHRRDRHAQIESPFPSRPAPVLSSPSPRFPPLRAATNFSSLRDVVTLRAPEAVARAGSSAPNRAASVAKPFRLLSFSLLLLDFPTQSSSTPHPSLPSRLLSPPPPTPPPPPPPPPPQGYFELDVPEAPSLSALSGSLLRLDRGGGDGEGGGGGGCVDTAVGLPPPISLGALVPIFEKGGLEESGGGGRAVGETREEEGEGRDGGLFSRSSVHLDPKKTLEKNRENLLLSRLQRGALHGHQRDHDARLLHQEERCDAAGFPVRSFPALLSCSFSPFAPPFFFITPFPSPSLSHSFPFSSLSLSLSSLFLLSSFSLLSLFFLSSCSFLSLSLFLSLQHRYNAHHSYTKLFGGPDFDAATFYSSFGTTLGIGEASRGGTADLLLLSTQGREGPGTPPERDAVKAQAFSLQVLTSLAVGGRGLAGLVRREELPVVGFSGLKREERERERTREKRRNKRFSLFKSSLFSLSLNLSPPFSRPLLYSPETGRDPRRSRRGHGRRHLPRRGVDNEVWRQV